VLTAETVNFSTHTTIYQNSSSIFYVSTKINNEITTEFVVDTGLRYVTMNYSTLKDIKKGG